jgi:hypothetical protein
MNKPLVDPLRRILDLICDPGLGVGLRRFGQRVLSKDRPMPDEVI